MAKSERVNPKTGKIQYKSRYYWVDENGKKHDAQTGWFDTKRDADKEAKALKTRKELECNQVLENNRNLTLGDGLDRFVEWCKEQFQRSTTEKTTTMHTRYNRAQTIRNKYMPEYLVHKKIKDLDPYDYRKWIAHINTVVNSGQYVHGLRDAIIKFNEWLAEQGYYSDVNFDMQCRQAIMQVKLKKKEKVRHEHTPTIGDLDMIQNTYRMQGLGNFWNLYHFTLFSVLFYTGLRVSELCALTWKDVDFKRSWIHITDSIKTHAETNENIKLRLEKNVEYVKTEDSRRYVNMFAPCELILRDYLPRYCDFYNLKEDEIGDCFVFPRLRKVAKQTAKLKQDPKLWFNRHELIQELHYVCDVNEIGNVTLHQLRHATATWMVGPVVTGGLGYSPDRSFQFFGHKDQKQINEIYANLMEEEKAHRNQEYFDDLMLKKDRPDPYTYEKELSANAKNSDAVEDANDEIRLSRIKDEILRAINNKEEVYHFDADEFLSVVKAYEHFSSIGLQICNLINIQTIFNGKEIVITEDLMKGFSELQKQEDHNND